VCQLASCKIYLCIYPPAAGPRAWPPWPARPVQVQGSIAPLDVSPHGQGCPCRGLPSCGGWCQHTHARCACRAATGEVVWSLRINKDLFPGAPDTLISRTSIAVDGHVMVLGTQNRAKSDRPYAYAIALDRLTGREVWRTLMHEHPAAIITQVGAVRRFRVQHPGSQDLCVAFGLSHPMWALCGGFGRSHPGGLCAVDLGLVTQVGSVRWQGPAWGHAVLQVVRFHSTRS
jgi:hypothetical protein